MGPTTVSDSQLHDALLTLFRAHGFDGVSLTDLQSATGLKKSSLYHRFPGGKVQMATSLLDGVLRGTEALLLVDIQLPLRQQITDIGERLRDFYADGRLSCLLASMSVGDPPEEIATRTAAIVNTLIDGLTALAVAAGHPRLHARSLAVDAIASIEGALVLSRLTGDTSAFSRTIDSLPDRLGP